MVNTETGPIKRRPYARLISVREAVHPRQLPKPVKRGLQYRSQNHAEIRATSPKANKTIPAETPIIPVKLITRPIMTSLSAIADPPCLRFIRSLVGTATDPAFWSGQPKIEPVNPNRTDDELAALKSHSITSSARAIRVGRTVMPSALAVLRLSTNSNFVGCITGNSAGLAPLSTRPVRTPAWR
jgi:hypothetical protein